MGMLSKFEEAVLAKVGTYTPEGRTASGRAADCRKVAMCEAKQHGEGQRGACRNWAPSAGPVTSRSLQPQVMVMREARSFTNWLLLDSDVLSHCIPPYRSGIQRCA
jgi:hypothetical protein